MIKKITCIECPKGCALSVEVEGQRVLKVNPEGCPKGKKYAADEIENPLRILTAIVLAEGLSLRMVPVRTDQPIPKAAVPKAAAEVRKLRINKPVRAGDIVVANLMNLGANLIATRDAFYYNEDRQ